MRKTLLIISLIAITGALFAQVDGFRQEGKASFYADKFEGRTTASGERYSHKKATCAHLSLPFGTLLKITNIANNKVAVVRVNDRGPFVPDRIIDVSKSVAERLEIIGAGVGDVIVEVVSGEGDLAQQSDKTPEKPNISNTPPKQAQVVANQTTATPTTQPSTPDKPATPATPTTSTTQPPAAKPVTTSNPASPVTPTPQTSTANDAQASKSIVELFCVKIKKDDTKGFSVQIASHKEQASVLKIISEIDKSFENDVRVQVTTLNGEKVYRVLLGIFPSQQEARKYKDNVAKIYSDCFIVGL